MSYQSLFRRYQELQDYVGWTEDDAGRVASVGPLLEPSLTALVDDFYEEISRHPEARKVITGGEAQIARLKTTLVNWLRELLSGKYDAAYVDRRWRVGYRHVEIGLNQVYTNVALSRLRRKLEQLLSSELQQEPERRAAVLRSLNSLIDLDLAIIEDAYQSEFVARQERQERLATIGRVAGGVAHELRNPLNVVKTSVYFLLHSRNASAEKLQEHLNRIERQVGIADGVIGALSDFAKLPVPERVSTSIPDLIRDLLPTEAISESIVVDVQCPADLPHALVDGRQLRIALSNLIRNARDAMPNGGRLTIACTARDGTVGISVKDTGTGIPPENLRRIMEPFFSTKARGIGLGLALSRAILDKNKGTLHVESELSRGSTFTIQLDHATDDAE